MTTTLIRYSSHFRQLLRIGIPIVFGQLGVIVLGFADTLMIGHYGTAELASASFVNNVFNLAIIFCTGFSYGLTPLIGSCFGNGNRTKASEILKNSLLSGGVVAVGLIVLLTVLYFNLHRLGQPDELLPYIRPYFIIILVSLLFLLLFNSFKQFFDGITDTQLPMWILIGGNLLNIIGNYLLIYGAYGFPELGLRGAGLSTLFSRIAMLAAIALVFFKHRRYRTYRDGFVQGKINRNDFRQLNAMGLPVGLQMGMETGAFTFSAIMIGWLGSAELAAYQIMVTVGTLGFMIYYGMGAALTVRISNFIGQNDLPNVRRATRSAFCIILLLALFACLVFYLIRHQIGYWFTSDEEVIAIVGILVFPLIAYQFGDALQITFANALRGIYDVKPMMWIALFAYILFALPVGYFCGFTLGWGITGVWMAFPAGLFGAGILFAIRYLRRMRTLEKEK